VIYQDVVKDAHSSLPHPERAREREREEKRECVSECVCERESQKEKEGVCV